ncbi:MAG: hypothetical protein ABMA64_22180 [Myxococcota bacterium]
MSVLRRLFNVASGSVLVWNRDRRAPPDAQLDEELARAPRSPAAPEEPDPDTDEAPVPVPSTPKPRRL